MNLALHGSGGPAQNVRAGRMCGVWRLVAALASLFYRGIRNQKPQKKRGPKAAFLRLHGKQSFQDRIPNLGVGNEQNEQELGNGQCQAFALCNFAGA